MILVVPFNWKRIQICYPILKDHFREYRLLLYRHRSMYFYIFKDTCAYMLIYMHVMIINFKNRKGELSGRTYREQKQKCYKYIVIPKFKKKCKIELWLKGR